MRKNSVKNTRINTEVAEGACRNHPGGNKGIPEFAPLTSVVAVEVSPDLKTCKAWISVLGDEKAQADTLAGLRSAAGFIKSSWRRKSIFVITPEVCFIMISPLPTE